MKRLQVLFVLLLTVFFSYTVVAQNWQVQNSNFPANISVEDFSAVNDQVCWAVGATYPREAAPYSGYIRTTDGGNNWVCDSIPGLSNGYFQLIFATDANTAYATVYVTSPGSSKGIYKTTDAGTTWNRQNAFNTSLTGPGYIHFFDAQNGVVIGDPNLETYTTSDGGLNWNPVTMPVALSGETTWLSGNGITASGNTVWFSTGARLFRSTDMGYTWTITVSEPQYISWFPCIAFQDTLIGIYSLKQAGALTHLYRKTTNGGFTWNNLSNPILDNIAPTALQYIPGTQATYVVAGGMPQGMRGTAYTSDAGETWSVIDTTGNMNIIFPSNTVGWGSQYTSNIVQKYVGPPLPVPVELTSFIATTNGKEVILNWSTATELNNQGFEIQKSTEGKEFFTIGFVNGHGTTTESQNYIYVDRNLDDGKYFYRLKQVDYDGSYEYSDVVEVHVRSLNEYALEQNYPNPFNPSTTFRYSIPNTSKVIIKIYDILGKEIETLVNEEKPVGTYEVAWNASNLPSGVYFYQLKAVDPSTGSGQAFISTKKMILLK